MPQHTPYERKLIKSGKWDGIEHRKPGIVQFSPFARRYRDRMFFYQMLSLTLFIVSLILAWYAFLKNN